MTLIQNRYPIEYRSEIVQPLMAAVCQGESACLVGLAGVGKSNLVHFLEQPEAKKHYLPEGIADRTHFVSLSCRPGGQPKEEIFGAMLTAVWLVASRQGYDLTRSAPVGSAYYQMLRNVLRDFCDVAWAASGLRARRVREPDPATTGGTSSMICAPCATIIALPAISLSSPLRTGCLSSYPDGRSSARPNSSRSSAITSIRLQPYRPRDADDMLSVLLQKTEGLGDHFRGPSAVDCSLRWT